MPKAKPQTKLVLEQPYPFKYKRRTKVKQGLLPSSAIKFILVAVTATGCGYQPPKADNAPVDQASAQQAPAPDPATAAPTPAQQADNDAAIAALKKASQPVVLSPAQIAAVRNEPLTPATSPELPVAYEQTKPDKPTPDGGLWSDYEHYRWYVGKTMDAFGVMGCQSFAHIPTPTEINATDLSGLWVTLVSATQNPTPYVWGDDGKAYFQGNAYPDIKVAATVCKDNSAS